LFIKTEKASRASYSYRNDFAGIADKPGIKLQRLQLFNGLFTSSFANWLKIRAVRDPRLPSEALYLTVDKEKTIMKKLLCAALVLMPIAFHTAHAATEQQSKMKTCNAEVGDKKGDERKAFMKSCLSSKADETKGSPAQQAQRAKMKACNADAKDKKGDERKAFMRSCLKKN
jgi:hypothetical protein